MQGRVFKNLDKAAYRSAYTGAISSRYSDSIPNVTCVIAIPCNLLNFGIYNKSHCRIQNVLLIHISVIWTDAITF